MFVFFAIFANKTVTCQSSETVKMEILPVFIKDVVFYHVCLSYMIESNEKYTFAIEEKFMELCTLLPCFHGTICCNLYAPIFEEVFVTDYQYRYDLMCGLHAYEK